MRKLLRNILPQALIDIYKQSKKNSGLKQRSSLKENNQIVTEQQISDVFHNVGICKGDTILVHSSLSKIGYVEGGAKTIINSFLMVLGTDGTLAMPAFPGMGFNYDYVKTNPVFDVKYTPSKMGIITEEFRKQPMVKRSLHPTDSVCALGKHAEFLTNTHFNQLTPYNEDSPFYKLCSLNGKIILLGVDLNSLTNFHTLEDAVSNFKFPVYHQTIFNTSVVDEQGKNLTMKTKVHNPAYSKKRQCNAFIKPFTDAGLMTAFELGLAKCYMLDAFKLHQWMLDNYQSKGITLYTPQGS